MIDAPIGRSTARRTRMAVRDEGRPARTEYEVAQRFDAPLCSLLECTLETGRTHQIRVHLAAIGHPVVGDGDLRRSPRLDRARRARSCTPRTLAFDHPATGERLRVRRAAAARAARPCSTTWPSGALTVAARRVGSGRRRRGGRRVVRSTSSARVTRSRMRRVSSTTPTHTSCRMQWPSQWSGCSASGSLRAFDRGDDLGERDLARAARASTYPPPTPRFERTSPAPFTDEQDLLEIRLREARALRDLLHRGRPFGAVQRERQQRPGRVVATRRHLHAPIVASARSAPPCSRRFRLRARGTCDANRCVPALDGASVAGIVPALHRRRRPAPGSPRSRTRRRRGRAARARRARAGTRSRRTRTVLPELAGMTGGRSRPSCPSTTATALTSIATGLAPAQHGVLGYRMRRRRRGAQRAALDGPRRASARPVRRAAPHRVPRPRGPGRHQVRVPQQRASRKRTSAAPRSSAGTPPRRSSSTASALVEAGERFVYAYYPGVDNVAHEFGLHDGFYERELAFADRSSADLLDVVAARRGVARHRGSRADAPRTRRLDRPRALAPIVDVMAGDGRFRYLYARQGRREGARVGGRRTSRRARVGAAHGASCSTTAGSARGQPAPFRAGSATSCSRRATRRPSSIPRCGSRSGCGRLTAASPPTRCTYRWWRRRPDERIRRGAGVRARRVGGVPRPPTPCARRGSVVVRVDPRPRAGVHRRHLAAARVGHGGTRGATASRPGSSARGIRADGDRARRHVGRAPSAAGAGSATRSSHG